MPNVSDTYRSQYLRAADVKKRPGQKLVLTIREASVEQIGEEGQEKLVVYWNEDSAALVLNSTNARLMADALGDATEAWPGGKVEIGVKPVNFRGTITDGLAVLRVKPKAAPPAPKATPGPPAVSLGDDFPDDVPF